MVCLNENLILPETSSSNLKMDDWKTTFGAPAHFQLRAVSFGEGPISKQGVIFTFDHCIVKKQSFQTQIISLLFQSQNIFEGNLMVNHHGKPHHLGRMSFKGTFFHFAYGFLPANPSKLYLPERFGIPHFSSPFHKISKDFPNPQGLSLENPGKYPVIPFTSMTRWPWMSRGLFFNDLGSDKGGKTYDRYKWS